MNDKLQTKIAAAEAEVAEEFLDERLQEFRQEDRDRAMFVLGGIHIADRVAETLNAEAIKALITFQENRMYLALGYATFVEFLEKTEHCRISKRIFYDRKALLESEGEKVFNLLTELGVSLRKRKLLGRGNVELTGDTLIVHNGDEVTEIAIDDRSSILDAITALADANAEKAIKLDRQKEKLDAADGKIRDAHAETDKVRAARISEFAADAHMTARVELGLAFSKFTDIVNNLSDVEKNQFRDAVLEDVAAWSANLRTAYATGGNASVNERASAPLKGSTLEESLDNFLDSVDLDATDDNDGDLAAKL